MPSYDSKRGKFRVDLGEEFGKRVHSFEVDQKLNDECEIRVRVSLPVEKRKNIRLESFPTECQLKWGQKVVASGELSRSHDEARHVVLVYSCEIRHLKGVSSNQLFLQKTLKKLISELCSPAEVDAQFVGDFSQTISSLNLEGRTHYQILCELASKYGFVFVASSRGGVSFIRVGSYVNSGTLSGKELISLEGQRRSGMGYESLSIRYVDSSSTDPMESTLQGAEAKAVLGDFARHAGFSIKGKWFSQPKMAVAVRDRAHFDSAKQILKYQVAQKMLLQEQTSVSSFNFVGSVGDKISFEDAPVPSLQEGDYFLASLQVRGQSSLPVATYGLCRA